MGLLLALSSGCGANKDATEPSPSQPSPSQQSRVEAPFASAPTNPLTGVAALAGSWSGSADVKGYGMTTAVVTLDSKGEGHYLVSLSGVSRNGSLLLSFWDGRWLHAEALGQQERIRGTLTGNQLRLELPYVGTVVLQRAP
jgi:hypothetical protein